MLESRLRRHFIPAKAVYFCALIGDWRYPRLMEFASIQDPILHHYRTFWSVDSIHHQKIVDRRSPAFVLTPTSPASAAPVTHILPLFQVLETSTTFSLSEERERTLAATDATRESLWTDRGVDYIRPLPKVGAAACHIAHHVSWRWHHIATNTHYLLASS